MGEQHKHFISFYAQTKINSTENTLNIQMCENKR